MKFQLKNCSKIVEIFVSLDVMSYSNVVVIFYKTKRNIYIYDNLRCVRIPRKDPDLGQTLSRFALLAPSWDHLEN